jgi:hypothetical protein
MNTPTYFHFVARGVLIIENMEVLESKTICSEKLTAGIGTRDAPLFISHRVEEVHDWLDWIRDGTHTKGGLIHVKAISRLLGKTQQREQKAEFKVDEKAPLETQLTTVIKNTKPLVTSNGTYLFVLNLPNSIKNLQFSHKKKLAATFNVENIDFVDENQTPIVYGKYYVDLIKGVLELKPVREE